jgi:predicted anti-sigma-YlaC factor YlaD
MMLVLQSSEGLVKPASWTAPLEISAGGTTWVYRLAEWCSFCFYIKLRVLVGVGEAELTWHLLQRLLRGAMAMRFPRGSIVERAKGLMSQRAFGRGSDIYLLFLLGALAVALSGCSVRKFAINKLGDSLANSGTTFASDNDPEFVGQAIPFSLKLIEGLLAESPKHRGLLFAAASGFTEYSYVYVQQPSEELESEDVTKSSGLSTRARNLYLRARDYGLRGLETKHRGFAEALRANPKSAVRVAKPVDVPLLYWTAVSWGAAISLSKDRPDLIAEQPQVEALIDRAYELNPGYEHGVLDQFLISYESARQGAPGDFAARSKAHFDRAVALTDGQLASPFVSYAETVSVQKQNRVEFESLLKQALAVDPDSRPEWRLSNLIMQRRARWLLSREDTLFLE